MSMFEGPSKVTFYEPGMFKLLVDPSGAVGKHMKKIGLEIVIGAQAMAGVRSGKLKRKISMRQAYGRYQYVVVSANVPYAEMHHEGTSKHQIIAPHGRVMRFNVGGKVVYARKVSHPGTKSNKYLTVPMKRAVKR